MLGLGPGAKNQNLKILQLGPVGRRRVFLSLSRVGWERSGALLSIVLYRNPLGQSCGVLCAFGEEHRFADSPVESRRGGIGVAMTYRGIGSSRRLQPDGPMS